jgi:hypothetical protein
MVGQVTLTMDFAGQIGVNPRKGSLTSSDVYATIVETGYASQVSAATSVPFLPTDIICAAYNNGNGGIATGIFGLSYHDGIYTFQDLAVTGSVIGPGSSYDNAVTLFAGTSGNVLKTVDFTPAADSLFGYNGVATPANITLGSGLSISDNVLNTTGSGSGNVTGPESSVVGALTVFANTEGTEISELGYTPPNNSLLGYTTGTAVTSITAGSGITISGGVIASSAGGGNVTGSGPSVAGGLATYADTTGLLIEPSAIAVTNNTLVGYNSGALANITAGSGITISGGVIASTSGGGNMTGTGPSVVGNFPVYTDTTGLEVSPSAVTVTNNTLVGFNSGALHNITAGAGITISGGVITSSASGGNVVGPESSTVGEIACYDNTTGDLIAGPPYTPAANSLVGYNEDAKHTNITAGAGIIIEGDTISAAGAGQGDVTGPNTAFDGNFALFSGTTGKIIENTSYTPQPNVLVGYDGNSKVTDIVLGPTNMVITGGQLLDYQKIVANAPPDNTIITTNASSGTTFYMGTPGTNMTLQIPIHDECELGWYVDVVSVYGTGSEYNVVVYSPEVAIPVIFLKNSSGDVLQVQYFSIQPGGKIRITRAGQPLTFLNTYFYANGDII